MSDNSVFWVNVIISILTIFFSGFLGAYIATKWRFEKEIRLEHFKMIKQYVIQPLLEILNNDIKYLFDMSRSNVEFLGMPICDDKNRRVGSKYFLKENTELKDFLAFKSFYFKQVYVNLFEDLNNHFGPIKDNFEKFRSNLYNYSFRCISIAEEIQKTIEAKLKEINVPESGISQDFYNLPIRNFVNAPAIAVWVFKNLLFIPTNNLKIEERKDYSELSEESGPLLAIANKAQIDLLYTFVFQLGKQRNKEIALLEQQILEELSRMRKKLAEDFQDLMSLSKLPGKCKFIEV